MKATGVQSGNKITTMRKIFKSVFASLAVLFCTSLASCSNEITDVENENNSESDLSGTTENDSNNLVTISTITVPLYTNDSETPASRTSYDNNDDGGINVKWLVDDIIYVGVPANEGTENGSTVEITAENSGFKAYKVSSIDESGKTATFIPTGEAYTAEDGTNVLAFYGEGIQINTKYGQVIYKNPTKQSVNTNQNLKFLYKYDFMSASTTVTADGALDFKFQHEVGFLKLKMTNLDTNIAWQTIQISISGDGNSFKSYKYKNGVSYPDDNTTLNLNINYYNKKSEIEVFVAIIPTTFSQETDSKMEIILTDKDGTNEMRRTLKPGAAIEAGKCYPIEVPMTTTISASDQTGE